MLQQVLEHLHNWFIKKPFAGEYTVASGVISPLDFLLEGQRFRIIGSVFNDGVYTYHSAGIKNDDDKSAVTFADETFTGTILALAVPKAVIDLSGEIGDWVTKYGDTANGPFISESFADYKYTRMTNSKVNGGDAFMGWQSIFRDRLAQWRKLC